jgi:Ni,Fe-hydrogenase I cytochrome b subunit
MYAVTILMVVTGFAMYGQYDPGSFWFRMFNWVGGVFGGMQYVRFTHHITTWIFILFIPMHIYLSLRADGVEKTGTISSAAPGRSESCAVCQTIRLSWVVRLVP